MNIEQIKTNFEVLIIGAGVGFAIGMAVGVKYLSKFIASKCVITSEQVLIELNKLPAESTSATIQMPFIKKDGKWVGYRP